MDELRYGFGKNWGEFVQKKLSDKIIHDSMEHMRKFARFESLAGKTFLDIGCGSGIHSLAALKLGADRVVSFDYDENSVATSRKVREWAGIPESRWKIFQGSALDKGMMASLGKFDVVYSWGVLHHTGAMWDAIRASMIPVKRGGEYYIALYSSDIYLDPTPAFWIKLKRAYNQADPLTRKLMELKYVYWIYIRPEIEEGRDPLGRIANYGKRGMTCWTDAKDWMGGYPMEFAGYQETRAFCEKEGGFDLVNVLTGEGCTEYLFSHLSDSEKWSGIEQTRQRKPMTGPFNAAGGHAYTFNVPELADAADSPADHMRSRVMIYENDRPLAIAHCTHADVRGHGGGRFSHWNNELIFSASDNSDPNWNGRQYSYCETY
ncbi:MAG TPA: class I SAM-dependent methyltransferase [Hyphomonadaceae bacterium]|nr:class I SAM-dependent methyltransferase [Hyphomonadaceae bacterium]